MLAQAPHAVHLHMYDTIRPIQPREMDEPTPPPNSQRLGQWIYHRAVETILLQGHHMSNPEQWNERTGYMRIRGKGVGMPMEQKGKQGYWYHDPDPTTRYRYITYGASALLYHPGSRIMPMRGIRHPTQESSHKKAGFHIHTPKKSQRHHS